ncbi:hypothetical protein LINPERHAP1_LOCUS14371 [Linum perenne]
MAEWSKAPDSSSGLRKRAWVQIPLLTNIFTPLFCYIWLLAYCFGYLVLLFLP